MALTAAAEQSVSKRGVIVGIVAAMHVLGYWVIESGLSRQLIELVAPPVETKIIEEDKPKEEEPPPPPPPDMPIEPPPFVPPPEVQVQVAVQANAIASFTAEKPPEAPPAAPPAPPPAVPGTKPRIDPRKSRSPDEYYPSAAARAEQTGSVVVSCLVDVKGRCADAKVVQSSGFELLDQAAVKYANEGVRMVPGTMSGAPSAMTYEFRVTFKQTR